MSLRLVKLASEGAPGTPSFRSKLFEVFLRLTGAKAGGSRLRELVERGKVQHARPPKRMYGRYRITTAQVNGQIVYTVSPKQGAGEKHIYYLHGGGYVEGFGKNQWRMIGKLVSALNCTLTAPDYPLPPQYHVDDVFAMVLPIYKDLIARVKPVNLTIMGDSAGGGMGLALAQKLRDEGIPQPANIILLSPWLDVTMTNPDILKLDKLDPMINVKGLADAGELYAAGADRTSYLISPVYGSLKGLGRITVFIGSHDVLVADCRKLKAQAEAEGVAIDYHEHEGMVHVWMYLPVPEARETTRQIIEVVGTH